MYLVCAWMFINFMNQVNHFGCCSKEGRRAFAAKKLSMVCDLKSLLVFSENADIQSQISQHRQRVGNQKVL